MTNEELYHHGVLGMKWGVRRTPEQLGHKPKGGNGIKSKFKSFKQDARLKKSRKKREQILSNRNANKTIGKNKSTSKNVKEKTFRDMSDDELQKRISRLEKEKRYLQLTAEVNSLSPKHVSAGQKFVKSVVNDVVAPAAKKAGQQYLEKAMKDALGLNNKSELAILERQAKTLKTRQEIEKYNDWFERRNKSKSDSFEDTTKKNTTDTANTGDKKTKIKPNVYYDEPSTKVRRFDDFSGTDKSIEKTMTRPHNRATDDDMSTVTKKVVSNTVKAKANDINQNNPIRQAYKEQLAREANSNFERKWNSQAIQRKVENLPGKKDGKITDMDLYTRSYNQLYAEVMRDSVNDVYYDRTKKPKRNK